MSLAGLSPPGWATILGLQGWGRGRREVPAGQEMPVGGCPPPPQPLCGFLRCPGHRTAAPSPGHTQHPISGLDPARQAVRRPLPTPAPPVHPGATLTHLHRRCSSLGDPSPAPDRETEAPAARGREGQDGGLIHTDPCPSPREAAPPRGSPRPSPGAVRVWGPARAATVGPLASQKSTPVCKGAGRGPGWGAAQRAPVSSLPSAGSCSQPCTPGVPRTACASRGALSVYGFQGRGIFLQRESPHVASSGKTMGEGRRQGERHPPNPATHPGTLPTAPPAQEGVRLCPGNRGPAGMGSTAPPASLGLAEGPRPPGSRSKAACPQPALPTLAPAPRW